jgi:hypothetical protein
VPTSTLETDALPGQGTCVFASAEYPLCVHSSSAAVTAGGLTGQGGTTEQVFECLKIGQMPPPPPAGKCYVMPFPVKVRLPPLLCSPCSTPSPPLRRGPRLTRDAGVGV